MVGIEIARAARIPEQEIQALAGLGTERGRIAAALLGYSHRNARRTLRTGDIDGAGCPDGAAMTVVLDEDAVTQSGQYYVDVETRGELTQGETVVDRRGVLGRAANATVVHAIDAGRFHRLVRESCR
jgi:inosine-uridine nucleoside N-ribohydrolase